MARVATRDKHQAPTLPHIHPLSLHTGRGHAHSRVWSLQTIRTGPHHSLLRVSTISRTGNAHYPIRSSKFIRSLRASSSSLAVGPVAGPLLSTAIEAAMVATRAALGMSSPAPSPASNVASWASPAPGV